LTKIHKIFIALFTAYYLAKLVVNLSFVYLFIRLRLLFWKHFSQKRFKKTLCKNDLPPSLRKRLEEEYTRYLNDFTRSINLHISSISYYSEFYRGYERKD